MFNEKELRIGSLVLNKDARICKVTHVQLGIDGMSVSIACDPPGHMVESISGITLTEEILIKAGFKKEHNSTLPGETSYQKKGVVLNRFFQLWLVSIPPNEKVNYKVENDSTILNISTSL